MTSTGSLGFPVVGVVGGGQLARMMQPAAIALGVRLRVLAVDAGDSAAQVVPDVQIGDHRDLASLRRFARGCDVVTFDHEHVPYQHLTRLRDEGVVLRPGPDALRHAQDKSLMRRRLTAHGVPCPRWRVVRDGGDVADFARDLGADEVVLKAALGYDGRGVWVVRPGDPLRQRVRCWPRSGSTSLASSPSWSPAARTARRRRIPWSDRFSPTASAAR